MPAGPTIAKVNTDLIFGCREFKGKRLQVLQIGLGTFGTVVQNLTQPDDVNRSVT